MNNIKTPIEQLIEELPKHYKFNYGLYGAGYTEALMMVKEMLEKHFIEIEEEFMDDIFWDSSNSRWDW